MMMSNTASGLRYGPYAPPKVDEGDIVTDLIRGSVRVKRWRDTGQIMWPVGVIGGAPGMGAAAPIMMGDLFRAICTEAALAVAEHWGVSPTTVSRWKRKLGIGRMTAGSIELARERGNEGLRQYSARGNEMSRHQEVRRRRDETHAATMKGKARDATVRAHLAEIGRKGGSRPKPGRVRRTLKSIYRPD